MIGWSLLLVAIPTKFSRDHKRSQSGIGRKWNRSNYSDPNSDEFMSTLTTPIVTESLVLLRLPLGSVSDFDAREN